MKISGKILDETGQPLALANVTIISGEKAEKMGTVADLDGNFTLESDIIVPASTFRISYLGYTPQVLKASDLVNATIRMQITAAALAAITVFGKPKEPARITQKFSDFREHLNKHKFVYAALGALIGAGLVVAALKK